MTDAKTKILVWDAPVRVFHWLLVLSFFGAYLTAESERWRLVHVTLGYTLGGLVAFRILWGLMGTRYARFASFVRGPAAVMRYGRTMLGGHPEHHVGHNPAGALAIVLLLLSSIAITVTGWALYNDVGGNWFEELHEGAANFMLALVGVHVAGVFIASWLHRENLVRAMVTGKKEGVAEQGIRQPWRWLAAIIVLAVLGFWWLQWQSAPSPVASSASLTSGDAKYGARAHDDDD
jgi:cytochrome b